MAWKSPFRPWVAAILSGLLLALCFPNWDRSQLVWLWQAPVLLVLWFYDRPEHSLISWRLLPRMRQRLRDSRWGRVALAPVRALDWILDGGTHQSRGEWGFKVGYLAGFSFFLVNLAWLRFVAWPGWILLAAYLAVFFGVWGCFAATLGRIDRTKLEVPKPAPETNSGRPSWASALTAPNVWEPSFHTIWIAALNGAVWVALEWVRGWLFSGFGWNGLGVALHDAPHLIQIADVIGVTGLAFVPVYVTCAVVSSIVRLSLEMGKGPLRPRLDFISAMCLIVLLLTYGVQARFHHKVQNPVELRALLVQGNVPMSIRNDMSRSPAIFPLYEKLTTDQLIAPYDLILWPETPLPFPSYHEKTVDYLNRLLGRGDFALLTGMEQVDFQPDSSYKVYNSMYLLKGSFDSHQAYQKIHRVPFGEFIPFRKALPLFEWILGRLIPGDYDAGSSTQRLSLDRPKVDLIPSICFEDTLGDLARRFVQDDATGPQLMVNLTNDGWFEQSSANRQHLANAQFRCVELKRPMLRCANTGISCAIDEFGALMDPKVIGGPSLLRDAKTGSPFIAGALPVTMKLDPAPVTTFYALHGNWFPKLGALLVILVMGRAWLLRWMGGRAPAVSTPAWRRPVDDGPDAA